jgi:hypothetical protein
VIRKSSNDEFDTVFFFDKSKEAVIETQKRIPGANGFPGDFVEIVLQAADGDAELGLHILTDARDTREVRQKQMRKAQLGALIESFPYDVVNLDVEQYLFHPKERLPGVLTNAMRRMLEWQRREGIGPNGKPFTLDEFTLMFTTQVGPTGLPDEYMSYLREHCLVNNLAAHQELNNPFLKKSNGKNPTQFFQDDFDGAFKLAVPKGLSELALEQDWFIDDARGIKVYQFDRPFAGGTYRMLHMAMAVKRQAPPREQRAPGQQAAAALGAHKNTIIKIFDEDVVAVESLVAGKLEDETEGRS